MGDVTSRRSSSDNENLPTLRDCWAKEDDFTRWLAEDANLRLLSGLLELELVAEGTQVRVGSLWADLVCTYRHEAEQLRAVIENQFTRSDHDHLAKLQVYGANLEDVRSLIWIAPVFRNEHLQTIDLLNEHNDRWTITPVVAECVHAGGGEGVARFRIATPDDAPASAGSSSRRREGSGSRASYYRSPETISFLTSFIAHLHEAGSLLARGYEVTSSAFSEPPYVQLNLGGSQIKLKGRILPEGQLKRLQVELLLRPGRFSDRDAYERYVDYVAETSARLEAEFPQLSDLIRTDDREVRFIVHRDIESDVRSAENRSRSYGWLRETMEAFLKAFAPIISEAEAKSGP